MTTDLVLDTDIGSDVDDLLALATILGSPSLRLRGVTTVYGDTTLRAQMVARACRVAGRNVHPILAGLERTRSGREVWWAGHEGQLMPDLHTEAIDSEPSAVQFLAASTTVAAVGPLTNLAAAVEEPDHRIGELFIMGGNFTGDRIEHNISSDADAADAVFCSPVPTTAVGLDQTTRVRIDNSVADALDQCGAFGTLLAAEIRQYWNFSGAGFNVPHDPIAILMITDPDLFEFSTGRVEVLTTGEDVGRTVFAPDDSGPHRIVSDLDEDRVPALISERMVAAARAARA
jgi:purine nucleosidase